MTIIQPQRNRFTSTHPKTLAIITAAGTSSRAGCINKLTWKNDSGTTLLEKTYEHVRHCKADHVQILLPPEEELYEQLKIYFPKESKHVSFKRAHKARRGLTNTLICGIETALEYAYDNLLVILGDMPFVTATHYDRLIDLKNNSHVLVVTTSCKGRSQPPVIWDKRLFKTLKEFSSSQKRRSFLRTLPKEIVSTVPVQMSILRDFDSFEDLQNFK